MINKVKTFISRNFWFIIWIVLIIGPIYGIIFSLINAKKVKFLALIAGCIGILIIQLLVIGVFGPEIEAQRVGYKDTITHYNLREIMHALDEYYSEHKVYPESVEILNGSHYFPNGFPTNPYRKPRTQLKDVKFGVEEEYGNFTYIPINTKGRITKYFLLGYGTYRNMDVDGDGVGDHVITVYPNSEKDLADLQNILRRK